MAALSLASCAAAPVTLYTLSMGTPDGSQVVHTTPATVIAVARITLPDYLDTQDILVRHGSVLESSHSGRWGSRLSLAATDLVVARLAQSRPDALVTDQPQTTTPPYSIVMNISLLDLARDSTSAAGSATLNADWMIIPRNPVSPTVRDRVHIQIAGAIGNDKDVVALTRELLTRLATAIDLTRLH